MPRIRQIQLDKILSRSKKIILIQLIIIKYSCLSERELFYLFMRILIKSMLFDLDTLPLNAIGISASSVPR